MVAAIVSLTVFILHYLLQQISTMEVHVARKYRLGHKIGSGSFGVIYIGNGFDLTEPPFDWHLHSYQAPTSTLKRKLPLSWKMWPPNILNCISKVNSIV